MTAIGEMFADDLTRHEFGRSPLAGSYAGCAEVSPWARSSARNWPP